MKLHGNIDYKRELSTDDALQKTIDHYKNNLRDDQKSFLKAFEEFNQLTPLFINENLPTVPTTNSPSSRTSDQNKQLMFTPEPNKFKSIEKSSLAPYGLSGIGEYDERRKLFLQERKKDYLNYLNEQNAKPRSRSVVSTNNYLDYEELLSQKRQLEQDYRILAGEAYFANNGMKPSKSESNVNRLESFNTGPLKYGDLDLRANIGDQNNPRPRSYPPEIGFGSYSTLDVRRDDPYGKRSSVNDVHLFSYNTDRRFPLTESLSRTRWKSDEERKVEYQAELVKQMENDRIKKEKMKREEEMLNKKIEEENIMYDPWGRGGGGAPRRDRYGNVIASRRQVEDYKSERKFNGNLPEIPLKGNKPVLKPEETQPNYTVQRSPPMPRHSIQDERRIYDNYKEELKRQVEEKKLQDQIEKEKERLEDQKLERRFQEQQEKMKREFEEDQKKSRLREEERRKRNEDLQRRHEEARKETHRKKRELREDNLKNKWEARQKELDLKSSTDSTPDYLENSPPIPSIKTKNLLNSMDTNDSAKQEFNDGRPQDENRKSSSRNHILSQLSVMRQQLEKEQQQIKEQLKNQMDSNYIILDQNKANQQQNTQVNHISEVPNHNQHDKSKEVTASSSIIYRPASTHLKENTNKGVEGYDSVSTTRWRQPLSRNSHNSTKEDPRDYYEKEKLASQEAAMKRYLNSVNNDPDEINADSFLDEYLARNIKK